MNNVHYSSATDQHNTPKWLVERVSDYLGGIELDPATSPDNPTGAKYFYTERENGLAQEWKAKTLWLNPPYGRTIGYWTSKLINEYRVGNVQEAIALLPARTDTRWWDGITAYPVLFIRGRLRFNDCDQSAPFPSALLYLGRYVSAFHEAFHDLGHVYLPLSPA